MVDDNYFSTLGIRILAGRSFDSSDRENGPDSIVINRKMAETFWPGQDAVGKSLMAGDPARKAVVIGVTADGKYGQIDEETRPVMYYSLSQHFQSTVVIIAKTRATLASGSNPSIKQFGRSAGSACFLLRRSTIGSTSIS